MHANYAKNSEEKRLSLQVHSVYHVLHISCSISPHLSHLMRRDKRSLVYSIDEAQFCTAIFSTSGPALSPPLCTFPSGFLPNFCHSNFRPYLSLCFYWTLHPYLQRPLSLFLFSPEPIQNAHGASPPHAFLISHLAHNIENS